MRVLKRSGIPAYVYGSAPAIEQHSRWYRPVPLRSSIGGADLAELLGAVTLESAMLIPCSDFWAQQVADLRPELRERFPVCTSTGDAIGQLVDKARFGQLLQKAGIPHPLTRMLEAPADLEQVPDDVLDGAFLKPHDSQRFFARFGVKAFQISSRTDGMARMREIQDAGLHVLLQQYIPGPGSLHYFVDGFVDRGGMVRAVFARRRLRMHPQDFGNSSFMVSIAEDEARQAIDSIRTLLGVLGYRGMFSAEFKRDPRDGVFKLIEVNARAWWYVEFAARCGVDVCTMAYRDALGLPVSDVASYRVGERLVFPYYDYFACRQAHRAGTLSQGEWVHSWLGAQEPLFNWSDPMPAITEFRNTVVPVLLRKLGLARRQ